MPFVVSLVQNKGGCGKTSFATSLYAAAVCRGDSSCIMDLDPQGNATAWSVGRAGFVAIPQGAGAEQFCGPHGALTGARFTVNQNQNGHPKWCIPCGRLDGGLVIPSNPYMDRSRMPSVELQNIPTDTLVIDTPPQMQSTMFRSIVAQSDAVVVPIQPEPFCVQNIVELVAEIANAGGADLIETGRVRFVFNMVQKSVTHASWIALVSANWGNLLSPVVVARAMAWADVTNNANKWSPKSKPAKTADELWADIFNHVEKRVAA